MQMGNEEAEGLGSIPLDEIQPQWDPPPHFSNIE